MTKQLFILLLISSFFITSCVQDPLEDDTDIMDDMNGVCFQEVTGDCAALSQHATMVEISNNSCSGYCIMRKFLESCPTDLNINGQDLSVSGYLSIFYDNPNFGFDDVIATNVLVHESTHSLAHTEANNADDLYVILDCDTDWQVEMTTTFPSNELINVIDPELRTSRFEAYIVASQFHVTQTRGVYGLLNEYMSYYQSGLVTYEMSKSMNLLDNPNEAILYSINAAIPYYEFKYWILTYLIYAKENHPAIYTEILSNENFKDSFITIDQAFSDLADEISTFADPLSSSTEVNTINVIMELGSDPYMEMMSLLE